MYSAEACDDGNTLNGDGCDAVCIIEVCGDGILNNGPGICNVNGTACSSNANCPVGQFCTGVSSTVFVFVCSQ